MIVLSARRRLELISADITCAFDVLQSRVLTFLWTTAALHIVKTDLSQQEFQTRFELGAISRKRFRSHLYRPTSNWFRGGVPKRLLLGLSSTTHPAPRPPCCPPELARYHRLSGAQACVLRPHGHLTGLACARDNTIFYVLIRLYLILALRCPQSTSVENMSSKVFL